MAPFRGRGRGGGRGGARGSSRGNFRGGSRGGFRGGRGGSRVAKSTGKLARSGIRTRGGYRKFDSQRVKDVESSDSENEGQEVRAEDSDELSEVEDVEDVPKVKAYSTLMQAFQPSQEDGRKRKRRRVEDEKLTTADTVEVENGDATVTAGSVDKDEDEDEDGTEGGDEMQASNGDAGADADDDDVDPADPFEAHFASMDDDELCKRLKSVQSGDWRTEKQFAASLGSLTIYAPASNVQGSLTRKSVSKDTAALRLKKRLSESSAKHLSTLDELQQTIAPYVFHYSDILLANRTPDNASSLRSLACLHALNHVLKGRDKVLKNTTRLAQSNEPETLDLRDQGFTRPKVLILTETRQMAFKYGNYIIDLFQPEQVENRQRFKESFSAPIDDSSSMPEDYRELFEGNNDNSFLTGLKFTRKTLKFFSAFYASDIILASPLGLRRIIENEDKKKQDHDFLSSVELMIVDQAEAMQLQNWENVEVVLQHLNLQPRESHGTDFNRVRTWYLDGNAKHLRQTLVFSAYLTPEMNRLFTSTMLNVGGKVKLVAPTDGAITAPSMAGLGVKQTFSRFDSPSPAHDPDARFKYFTSAVLPSLLRSPKPADGAQGILVFIPSYFDFIRIRNYFATSSATQNVSFGAVHDYTEVRDQRRARSHFVSGRHSILLYTQRAHHFFRLRLKGVKRVVFYGVPDSAVLYEELVGGFVGTSIGEGRLAPEEAGVRAMFSKWDGLRMERVVGSSRVKGMFGGMGDTFDFV